MLRATGLSLSHGAQVVLDDISVSVEAGDRVGVVGPNGIGKSTLLRVLGGLERPDGGSVDRRPRTLTVGYLPQEADAFESETLLDYLGRRTGVTGAGVELDRLTAALSDDATGIEDYSEALDRFLALGGDDLPVRAAEVCAGVGLVGPPADVDGIDGGDRRGDRLHQTMTTLSGGEAARARLAAILLSRHDVLLLDEPTNNLDFAGLAQLESFVAGFAGGVAVVSHDRVFLDRVATRMFEIEEHSHRGREYAGGWSAYVEARDLARRQGYDAHQKYTAERDRLQSRQRRQIEWSETGARRAKRSGEPDKHVKAAKVARTEKQAGKVKATERKIAQLDLVEKPWEGWRLQLALQPTARSGDVVARLEGAVIERRLGASPAEGGGGGGTPPDRKFEREGDRVDEGRAPAGEDRFRLGPIDVEIGWQDRIGILGPNGSGKTTLVGGLLGTYPLVEGRRWLGPGVVVGELDQNRERFSSSATLLSVFLRDSVLPPSEARSLLAKFGLGADHVDRACDHLSPGERSRALLASLMAAGVNCLVLDEPTNHLDLAAIEQLEGALADFDGTLIVVSHDRRFLEAVDLTTVIDLAPSAR